MIKVLIFDFFDVLRTDGYKRWMSLHGFERVDAFLDASDRHDRGEYDDQQFFAAVSRASGEPVAQVAREMEEDTVLDHDLVAYIDTLHGSYRTALLSNSSSDYLRAELAKYDLEKHFDEIVISSEVGLIKPEPEIFQHILDKLGATPDECIFIDDNPRNTAGAESIGIHGIVYTDLPALKIELAKYLS